jgi:hypothetical protein
MVPRIFLRVRHRMLTGVKWTNNQNKERMNGAENARESQDRYRNQE